MDKMKYIIQILVAITLLGCTDEEIFKSKGDIDVTAGFAKTRTTFVEDDGITHVTWNTGDAIGLFTKEQNNLQYTALNDGDETKFGTLGEKITATEGEKVYAYYPWIGGSENPQKMKLPDIQFQSYNNNRFDFIYASSSVNDRKVSLQFKHLFAFIKITLPVDILSVEGDNIDPDNDIKQLIAEQIGAECEETWLVGQDKDDAINSLIATGEYPDFVLGETALYEADALIPIDEYWDDYPNIKEYLRDEQWEKLRQPDGHIYWIPPFGISHGDDVEMLHNGEAFWIQTRVLKWAGYPKITTIEQYFDLIESYVQANPTMPDGTENIPFTILCDDWRYFCLENVPQFLDGFPNDGSCMVDTETKKVMDYNVTDTAKRYFGKLNEEFPKGIMEPGAFNATYDQYLDKLSTGAVLGMVDQWWQFYYVIDPVFKKQNLALL